jgi:coenzyme F420-reducing hydrogenase alpha subunit
MEFRIKEFSVHAVECRGYETLLDHRQAREVPPTFASVAWDL